MRRWLVAIVLNTQNQTGTNFSLLQLRVILFIHVFIHSVSFHSICLYVCLCDMLVSLTRTLSVSVSFSCHELYVIFHLHKKVTATRHGFISSFIIS